MHSRKSVGPRMDRWGTLALPGYSCEDFSSRTTQSRLLLREEEISPNIWPEIPLDLSLWKRPVCQTLSKTLDISSARARIAPDLLKSPSNSIRHNCQKIYSWSRRTNSIREIKQATFLQVVNNPIIYYLPQKEDLQGDSF